MTARAVQIDEGPGEGGGDCGGGPISVTVTAEPSEVLIGHEATLTADVNGARCSGAWQVACPAQFPMVFLNVPPDDTTKVVCGDKIGSQDHIYAASSGGNPPQSDQGRATVTVVGPNEYGATGFGNPSARIGGGSIANISIAVRRDGESVGPCVSPTVEFDVFTVQGGEYESDGNGWRASVNVFWDTSSQRILHRVGYTCGEIDAVDVGGPIGDPIKYFYRVTYGTQCGATEGSFETGGFVLHPKRTGDCTFAIEGGPFVAP